MIRNPFRGDVWLKLLATGLAILLWAVVTQLNSEEATRTLSLPLRVVMHPKYEVFDGPMDGERTVTVQVRGPSLLLRDLSTDDFSATVDYRNIEHGQRVDAPVNLNAPRYVEAQVEPKTIPVLLVEKSVTEVPLQLSPVTEIWVMNNREYEIQVAGNREAQVSGRRDYLDDVTAGLVTVDQEDVREAIAKSAKSGELKLSKRIVPVDAAGRPVPNLEVTYSDVTVAWKQLPYSKSVQVEVKTEGTLPVGFVLNTATVEPQTVVVRTAAADDPPPDLTIVPTVPVDMTGRTTNLTLDVPLQLPAGYTANVETVKVSISVQERTIERTMEAVPVQVIGRSTTQSVELSAAAIRVRVRGPYTAVTALRTEDLSAAVDVEAKETGKSLLRVDLTGPAGVQLEADPALIEATISTMEE